MKRKIAAIVAADLASYSRLVAEDEEETLNRLASYRKVFEDFVTRAGGRVFNTAGDAILAEFSSSVEATRCAIDIQESLRTHNLGYQSSKQMLFRIGITIGDVVEREGDLLGDGVNIAARLEALAKPGGICVSRSVYEQVANKLSVPFRDIGVQEVKNIPQPVHAFMVELRGDGVKPPPSARRPAGPSDHDRPHKSGGRVALALGIVAMLFGAGAFGMMLWRENLLPFIGGKQQVASLGRNLPDAGAKTAAAARPDAGNQGNRTGANERGKETGGQAGTPAGDSAGRTSAPASAPDGKPGLDEKPSGIKQAATPVLTTPQAQAKPANAKPAEAKRPGDANSGKAANAGNDAVPRTQIAALPSNDMPTGAQEKQKKQQNNVRQRPAPASGDAKTPADITPANKAPADGAAPSAKKEPGKTNPDKTDPDKTDPDKPAANLSADNKAAAEKSGDTNGSKPAAKTDPLPNAAGDSAPETKSAGSPPVQHASAGIRIKPLFRADATPAEIFRKLSKSGGIVADPKTAPELYHNARVFEARGDAASARRAYMKLAESGTKAIDPHLRFAAMLRAQDGRAGARELYAQIAAAKGGEPAALVHALQFSGGKRRALVEAFAAKNPTFAPAHMTLADEYSLERLGSQTIHDRRREFAALKEFLKAEDEGKLVQYFLDHSVLAQWISRAQRRHRLLENYFKTAQLKPVASFMRSNSGWMVNFSLPEAATSISWKLGKDDSFRSTGTLPHIDQRTGRQMPNPSVELPRKIGAAVLQVRYNDASGRPQGPFTIPFEPNRELIRSQRSILERFSNSWIAINPSGAGPGGRTLIYYTHLVSYRCAIKSAKFGYGDGPLAFDLPIPECNMDDPHRIPSNVMPYLRAPGSVSSVRVQLEYRDGTKSAIKTFSR